MMSAGWIDLAGQRAVVAGGRAAAATGTASDAALLPKSWIAAIERFEASAFCKETLGEDVVSYPTRIRRAEWDRYPMMVSERERREYFSLFLRVRCQQPRLVQQAA
jgi:glutamine synthetase